jgi:hypothetical protein
LVVGNAVGRAVGDSVKVGNDVGLADGGLVKYTHHQLVGACVGASVGTAVGDAVITYTVPVILILAPQCGVHMNEKIPVSVNVCSTRCPSVVDPKLAFPSAVHVPDAVVCTTSCSSPGTKQTRCPTVMATQLGE